MAATNRILVKMRPQAARTALAASQSNLRPLYDAPLSSTPAAGFGLDAAPQWFLADLPDGGPNPWDAAHARVADQLGVAESDIVAAEPDLEQSYVDANEIAKAGQAFAAGGDCTPRPQATSGPRPVGPGFGWHLADAYSQLGAARDAVTFTDPRTRIGHIDTGYDKTQNARPENFLTALERNFVDGDGNPNSAQDPNRGGMFDNSGHGTGTSGILAGRQVPQAGGQYLGACPHAEILPMRIANSVVMFFTSNFAKALQYAIQQRCDVISISMGGLPSSAWNEAVNDAYEAGICIVAASGDCFAGLPSHHVVYPARYHRTIAACGVMEDGTPYYGLPHDIIEGSWGPDSCMSAALASYTPNIPWARITCPDAIDLDGQGTSACTPQIAAAVALWYEKYKEILPRDWRRVEAVRNALFQSAKKVDPTHFGQGILQANAALNIAPVMNLPKTAGDSDSFSFFRVITGLGVTDLSSRETMFNLELAQRYLVSQEMQQVVPDPEAKVPMDAVKQLMEAAIHDKGASVTLRKHIAERYSQVFGGPVSGAPPEIVAPPRAACRETAVSIPTPPFRRLRMYGIDPSFSTRLDTAAINEVTMHVRWESDLQAGPIGEYLEVVDQDAAGVTYAPVNLNDPSLLAQNGCAPAEGNPAFHQQAVYAVAMTTIDNFERALGRPVLWRPEPNPQNEYDDSKYRQRLRILPHALRQANAFYSPPQIALLFGYFQASASDPGDHVPGSTVYACLSHDIVAHETTHAILDGMHRRFNSPTNADVLALHEGFADIVALMQHFTIPGVLEHQIWQTRGNLESENMLGSLAVQFGRAIGGRGALRDAIGGFDDSGVWRRLVPDPAAYQKSQEPHARGAILVAAVFDAFLAIYDRRTADLLRIYTRGTGVLPAGAIHPDLVHRLAAEAAKSASHVLNMCIRALDYIPPVDITFGEYLRGIITADFDLVADDDLNYRVAFVEAFRKHGIVPRDLDTLSVDTLRWEGLDLDNTPPPQYRQIVKSLKQFADECFYLSSREKLFDTSRKQRQKLHVMLEKAFAASADFASALGLDSKSGFEVHELRRAMRTGPDGNTIPQIIAALTQSRTIDVDGPHTFLGGSTIVLDLSGPTIKYRIMKRVDSVNREARTAAFLRAERQDPLRALLVDSGQKEPFALLHSLTGSSGF